MDNERHALENMKDTCFGCHEMTSQLNDLLVSLNDLIDTIRDLQYDAERLQIETGSKYHEGEGFGYERCAELLTDIVKAH